MMKVYKLLITSVIYTMIGSLAAVAQYDFCQESPSGQMLYYRIVPGSGHAGDGEKMSLVMVTHPGKEWPYYADNKPTGNLEIPDSVVYQGTEYAVCAIGENAFYRCEGLTGVNGPGIVSVGTQAFCGCKALKNMVLGARLPGGSRGVHIYCCDVGEGAFAYCGSIEVLTLSPEVARIGISAFAMCDGLGMVSMPAEVERLVDATTFHGCPLMQNRKNREKSIDGQSGTVVWQQ